MIVNSGDMKRGSIHTAKRVSFPALVPAEPPAVLHVISTLEKAGGAQRLLLDILRGLPGYRHVLAVLTGALEMRAEFEALGVTVLDRRKRSLLDPIGVFEIRRLVRDERFALVHAHLSRAEIVGGLAVRPLAGVKLILFKQNDDAWWKRPVLGFFHRQVVGRADRIICTSDAVVEYFAELVPSARPKMTRIHNGIDTGAVRRATESADRAAVRASLGVPADARMLLAGGRLVEQKGHDTLVRALADPALASQRPVLVLVGRGEKQAALEDEARRAGVADRVIFAGVRDDVPALLAACDLFVMPSRWEGFGLAAVEAMIAGRAVVASRVSALPEVVEDGVTGTLVAPGDSAELARAIAALLADRARREALGLAGRARAERLFDAKRMAEEWRREYARVIPRASP